ncbi:hypothetical protein Aduo_016236 [Ancylostoma duodenale]
MNHRRRYLLGLNVTVLIIFATLYGTLAFSPFFIGPEFRDSSFVSEQLNDEIAEMCGRSKKSEGREYPWAVSIMLKVW